MRSAALLPLATFPINYYCDRNIIGKMVVGSLDSFYNIYFKPLLQFISWYCVGSTEIL